MRQWSFESVPEISLPPCILQQREKMQDISGNSKNQSGLFMAKGALLANFSQKIKAKSGMLSIFGLLFNLKGTV